MDFEVSVGFGSDRSNGGDDVVVGGGGGWESARLIAGSKRLSCVG